MQPLLLRLHLSNEILKTVGQAVLETSREEYCEVSAQCKHTVKALWMTVVLGKGR